MPDSVAMSGVNINQQNQFDIFTVLQDVGQSSLDGRVFGAFENGLDSSNILIGYEKEGGSDLDFPLGDIQGADVSFSDTEIIPDIAFVEPAFERGFSGEGEAFVDSVDTQPVDQPLVNDFFDVVSVVHNFSSLQNILLSSGRDGQAPNILTGTHDELADMPFSSGGTPEFIPRADTPSLVVEGVQVLEDNIIPLSIQSSLNDRDGQETLSIQISDVPEGGVLSAGIDLGDGDWRLSVGELDDLTLTMPEHYSGEFSLRVTAISAEVTGEVAQVVSALGMDLLCK